MIAKSEYLGDGLYKINKKTLDTDDISNNIVQHHDGDTVSSIIREYSGRACEYQGECLWLVDSEQKYNDQAVTGFLSSVLDNTQPSVLMEIIDNYFKTSGSTPEFFEE